MAQAIYRLFLTLVAAVVGYGVGYVGGYVGGLVSHRSYGEQANLADQVVLPHHIPQYQGGVSLRFAMVHDILVERFPRHGPAYYRERDRRVRKQLAKLAPDDPAAFDLSDDLAAGLERLGRSDEAVEIMRVKLARQEAKGLSGRDLYTSYANLGTFLIHASFKQSLAGDPGARDRFREGVGFVRESVRVNPEAHFGRERWQEAIAGFLLAAMDDPTLLGKFDCLGNRLDLGIESILNREENWVETGYGRPTIPKFSQGEAIRSLPAYFESDEALDHPTVWPEARKFRDQITKVGAEEGWQAVAVPSHPSPVPFDEPVLGIIGMWRQGGGANPHFALALGETMLRVGQRYIAWTAFERASRMAERFWPDPAIQQLFRDHCRHRQSEIEETLTHPVAEPDRPTSWQEVSPRPEPESVARLRSEFDAELARGEAFQRDYQAYETTRIEAGASINDEHFFDIFYARQPSIASEPGSEEWFVGISGARIRQYGFQQGQVWGLFIGGLSALLTALWLTRRSARSRFSVTPIKGIRFIENV